MLAAIWQQSGCNIRYVIDIMGHSIDRQQILHHLTLQYVAKIQFCDISATNQKAMHKNAGTNAEQIYDTLYI